MGENAQVTEQQKELATLAMQEFDRKQFTSCCNIMNKLMVLRGNDPRVVHNKAVADFCLSGSQSTDDFRQSLANVCQMAHVNLDSGEGLEDVDHSVLFYNQAIILYHLRQNRASLAILDKLFPFIDPLSSTGDEGLCKKVLLLQVELYLCTYQPEKAMGLLTYIEKNVLNGRITTEREPGREEGKEGSPSNTESSWENWRPMLSVFKTRCLVMMKSLKACKREIKALMNVQSSNTSVVFLKANFEYLRGNYRKAMKMLGSGPQMHTDKGECLTVMHYNNMGCVHFHLRKHHLGAFYFRKALQENENVVREMRRSTDQNRQHAGGSLTLSGRPLHCLGMSRHFELMYNMGIELLHCGKAMPAFECLIEAVQIYQVNPHLWLRLAECCIMAYRENNDDDRKLQKRQEVIQGSVGSGVHRKLIMGPGVNQDKNSVGTPAIPAATLEFASLCLRNALQLLSGVPETSPTDTSQNEDKEDGKLGPEAVLLQAPPGNPMRAPEVHNLRCSVLCASSYVALCLNDYTMALEYAGTLLKLPRISGAQSYLAHMYMGEALVSLDRIADGIQHLNPDLVTDVATTLPDNKLDPEKTEKLEKESDPEIKGAFYPWCPRDVRTAKAIIQYNLAAAHAVRGEYDKATNYLAESSKFIGAPLPAQMYFLKLYLDLIEGRRKMAQFVIKEHFGHVTPNRIDMKVASMKPGGNTSTWNTE
ncbi:CCR4-NOT transcription complex subunit 10-like isoform X2 [Mya arenaria]|uniref:CCR4-NOT transcription complex subunit 10-like isoform X2 n=1 Tax=Mya arenaria TaxID=6604 RepID=UPI0022E35BF6|nr:CCR4-NOT transcription complex subunit 10-like isoform X2 [Mya arenaria]XP_052817201.1 CCR4-NOT transcription complex subunit 10-like isoform X2 [Mya arenaria]